MVSSVVQVLRFWGQGCVRREAQRGERSDSASQRAQKPHLHPRETTDEERCRDFWAQRPSPPQLVGSSTGQMPQVRLE